jgi:olefin beta-lactone synthetase
MGAVKLSAFPLPALIRQRTTFPFMSFNVARFLPETASTQPTDCALKIPLGWAGEQIVYRSLTFRALEDLSNRCAHLLRQGGVKRGIRVQLAVKPGLELILITFALFKLGAVPVVIDPGMGLQNFLSCVKRTRPEVLVGIPKAIWLSRVFRGSFKGVNNRIAVNRKFVNRLSVVSADPILEDAASDDLAAILFTSGSTGAPKGVCYEHGMFDAQVRLIGETYNIQRGEVDLPMLPVFALFNPAFGMTTVVPDMNPSRPATVDPKHIVQAILQNEVTNSFGSPVLWKKISRYCREHSIQLPSIKRILMAGAPVPPGLIKNFKPMIPHGEIHTPYGATESLPVSSISGKRVLQETMAKTNLGAGTCVGQPVSGMKVRIIGITDGVIESLADAGELPAGEIGELIVKGPVVTREYDQLAEATAKAKIYDGKAVWHRMGDAGYQDQEGNLWFCGRVAERVQTKDGVLFTDPVEALFNQQAGVFRSALIGLGNAPDQTPAIVIEPDAGHWPDNKEKESHWATKLLEAASTDSKAARVKHVFFHRSFPVDVRHNAKIHRLTLAKEFSLK